MLLATGRHIVERLETCCPEAAGRVFTAADLAGVTEAAQVAPALHVVLLDYAPAETAPGGSIRWEEVWCVVALVKHAARSERAGAQMDAACPLLDAAIRALSGYRYPLAEGVWGTLKIVPGPRPHFDNAFAYFPVAVATTVVTQRPPG
ncbi:MAG: hypothetical protein LBL48_04830 [Azoarcus sp.]|jgi:hypothetical protein|nr:hypothetical protein [Azoarcus sp.]